MLYFDYSNYISCSFQLKASEVLNLERQQNDSQEKFERLNEENQGIIEGLEEDNDDFKFKTDTLQSELSQMKNEMIAITDANDKVIEESKTREQELNDAIKGLQLELEEAVEANKDSINEEIETLKSELSQMKNDMIAITDAKDKVIEEAHEKIANLESNDSSEEILVIKAGNEAQRLKIIELTSQIEQSREQKISCDLHLTNINDALENVKLQLSEREAEIAQLEDVIKQKTEEDAREKAAIVQPVSDKDLILLMYFILNFSF